MNSEIKAQWIARLRDPQARQTREVLEQVDENGNVVGQCCLGVLCELAAEAGVVERRFRYGNRRNIVIYYANPFDCNGITLPKAVAGWAELSDRNPYGPEDRSLVDLNDSGATFPEIADVIEEYL